jgi:hypothetical protein
MNVILLVSALTALAATIIATILGSFWYSLKCFGRTWTEFNGMDINDPAKVAEAKKGMAATYALSMLSTFVMFFLFAFLGVFVGQLNLVGALVYGAVMWLGFAVPMIASSIIWSGKSRQLKWKMFFISAGYQLICFLLTSLAWVLIYPHFFF